jgi:hypothetical protein
MKLYFGLPIVLILSWLVIRGRKNEAPENGYFSLSRRTLAFTILSVLIWVVLSGIGGFAFQNTDFHTRNAIFRDLINYGWPVKYNTNLTDPSITYSLTYYIGFWLPAALVGKLAGWSIANLALYIWTVIGILLTLLILFSSKKSHPIYFILLLIFFSGMDGLGTFILDLPSLQGKIAHLLWPPFMHIEWWIPGFQFSSFTTQLFWVFNQAVPTWLCMALIWIVNDRKTILLVWSLCAFYAPLPALGMLPFLALKIPKKLFNPENLKDERSIDRTKSIASRFRNDFQSILTIDNILGYGIVLFVTYFYFSANVISSDLKFISMSPLIWIRYIFFIVFEALLLWLVFIKKYKSNLNWYVVGLLIFIIPLVMVGTTHDFGMRASIPMLFVLMFWSAETLASPKSKMRTLLIVILVIGAITPVYEINRSIYRTATYFLNPPSQAEKISVQQVQIYEIKSFEYDHPFTLTADSFKSLANIDPETIPYFLAKLDSSFFYEYLSK